MDIPNNLKELILKQIIKILDSKIEVLNTANKSVRESMNEDTKSSAGDKYETGREMMQNELNKNNLLLQTLLKQKREISKINPEKKINEVDFGSLVITDNGSYFISIGLGKIEVNEQDIYAISLLSPIGKVLHKNRSGDTFTFQNREISILNIL